MNIENSIRDTTSKLQNSFTDFIKSYYLESFKDNVFDNKMIDH